jgi:hypothetical protein
LANDDGRLDKYSGWSFEGQRVVARAGLPGWSYAQFQTMFVGTVKDIERTRKKFTFNCRDRQEELNDSLPIPKYLGTNVGPTGIEGTSADLKGKFKPFALGDVRNMEPMPANTSKGIWQVHFRSCQDIPAARSQDAPLTRDADYADEVELAAATVAAGHYATCLSKGIFRTPATAEIRADVLGDNVGGYVNTMAGCGRRVLDVRGWAAGTDYSATDLATLDAKNSAVIGYFDPDGSKAKDIQDEIFGGGWFWYGQDRLGLMRFGRVEAPGTPLTKLTDAANIELDETTNSDLAGTPWSVATCQWGRNWSVMRDSQLTGTITADRRAWLAQQYRSATSTTDGNPDSTILARWPLAQPYTFTSLYVNEVDAKAEAVRRAVFRALGMSLFTFSRDWWMGQTLEIGQTHGLWSGRFELAGRPVVISGIEDVGSANQVRFTCYG